MRTLSALLVLSVVVACKPVTTNINTQQKEKGLPGQDQQVQQEDDEGAEEVGQPKVMQKKEGDEAVGETGTNKEDGVNGGPAIRAYHGEILAGSASPLLDFNKADYEQALIEGKLVILYFYANWCPTCHRGFPKIVDAFNQLETSQVVGFRVNFRDDETDDDEVVLAFKYNITYQDTKIIIKDGEKVLHAMDSWSAERYIEEINKFVN